MSLSIQLTPLISLSSSTLNLRFDRSHFQKPRKIAVSAVPDKLRFSAIRAANASNRSSVGVGGGDGVSGGVVEKKLKLEAVLGTLASLYPVYVTVGGIVACVKPSVFSWFVKRGPGSFTLTLGFLMLAMSLTLDLREFLGLFMQRPLSIFFGFAVQYTTMPTFAFLISKALGLSPALSVGLILVGCCPGGTASNVVSLIARGDVALSIVMTVCTTLGAVLITPLLTKILAGAYVPVDAVKLSISTLQVIVVPILLRSYLQSAFPSAVKSFTPFAPLLAILASSLLACSVFSQNVVYLKSSVASASVASNNLSPVLCLQEILCGDIGAVILSVMMLLHFAGFFVGYFSAAIGGFGESQRRAIAIAIEVGMRDLALGVVLATSHFTSQMVALPPAISAVIVNIMGSTLGFIRGYMDPSSHSNSKEISGDHEK